MKLIRKRILELTEEVKEAREKYNRLREDLEELLLQENEMNKQEILDDLDSKEGALMAEYVKRRGWLQSIDGYWWKRSWRRTLYNSLEGAYQEEVMRDGQQ